jgi:hypothetical protein
VEHVAAWAGATHCCLLLLHVCRVPFSCTFSHAAVVHATSRIPPRYIGETARYVLASPPGAYDRAHKVKVAWGNGMRPEVRGLAGWYSEYSEL